MPYASYPYYTAVFMGNQIAEDDFPRLSRRASEYLDYITMGKAARYEGDLVKNACCAIAELYQQKENADRDSSASVAVDGAPVASEAVGSWSRSYHSRAQLSQQAVALSKQIDSRIYKAAAKYLSHTGLLYRGGGRC